MDIHGDLNFLGNGLRNASFLPETNFPAVPIPGSMVFKDKVLYICTEIMGDLPVWVPLTKSLMMVKHSQTVAALEWTIPHTLNIASVFVQVYDGAGKWVVPDFIDVSAFNVVHVGFNTPMVGTAVIMRGDTEGAPSPVLAFSQDFTGQTTWVVRHGLGYNPIIRVMVGMNEVQPQSVVFNSTMQLTVTFSSPQTGSVRCI